MQTVNEIIMMPIDKVIPYDKNPRKNDKTVELLTQIIPKVGFNVPLVLDKENVIVKGHARFAAAIRLGMSELPCIITHADEEAIKADRITDNKISEFSEWINEDVLKEIESINFDFDFSDLGFPAVTFEGMPSGGSQGLSEGFQGVGADIPMGKAQEPPKAIPKRYYKCVCVECGHVMFVEESKIRSMG